MIHSHFLCFSDFDCILTNLELKKLDKNRFQLPEEEQERTQSILKRALDVEKGVSESAPVTEEHPDGCKYSTVELHLSDQLGPWGKFVENSTKLTCLEISGYQIMYNTVLYLLEL